MTLSEIAGADIPRMSLFAFRRILSIGSVRLSQYYSCTAVPSAVCGASASVFSSHEYSTARDNDHSDMRTVIRTYEKLFKLPEGYSGKVSRRNFKEISKGFESFADKIDSFFINSVLMKWADARGMDKFPEEGGLEITLKEMYETLKDIPKETVTFYIKALHRALFRAIDTNNNGVICRDEWANLLKLQNLYESDEHARRSFDSLDTNKDGVISMDEFENQGSSFWVTLGGDNKVKDMYGTLS